MAKMKRERKSRHRHRHRPISGRPPPSGTEHECFQSQVFWLPMSRIDAVMRIEPGAPLFLLDCGVRILYGLYRAASHGDTNLVPHVFGGKFQAQVLYKDLTIVGVFITLCRSPQSFLSANGISAMDGQISGMIRYLDWRLCALLSTIVIH